MTSAQKYKQLVYKVIGAAYEVHNTQGYGLLEPVYQESLHLELTDNFINAEREVKLECFYKKHKLEKTYSMDLLVEKEVVVELKAVLNIAPQHRAQLCNYLRLSKKTVGVLINFGAPRLQSERWVYDIATNHCMLVDKDMNPIGEEEDYCYYDED